MEIQYTETNLSNTPHNPLCDIASEDQAWIYETVIRCLGVLSVYNQQNSKGGSWQWEAVTSGVARLRKGRQGHNSIYSFLSGLLANYVDNAGKYGGNYRFSLSQLQDLETRINAMHRLDQRIPSVVIRRAMFDWGQK